jgi:hypothetical protein
VAGFFMQPASDFIVDAIAPQSIVEVFPAAHLFPAVDDAAEQLGGLLGVVARRVRLATIEVDVGA